MDSEKVERPYAKFLERKQGAGRVIWAQHLESHGSDIDRRAGESRVIYWYPHSAMPLDLFSYIREAARSYELALFLGAVSTASAFVETILNRDSRLRGRSDLRRIDGWILLNNQNLLAALRAGYPVGELLDSGESVESGAPIQFVEARNKVAHGDLGDFPDHLSDYSPVFEATARSQLDKASHFLVTWFNTSPDIQDSGRAR